MAWIAPAQAVAVEATVMPRVTRVYAPPWMIPGLRRVMCERFLLGWRPPTLGVAPEEGGKAVAPAPLPRCTWFSRTSCCRWPAPVRR